MQAKSGIYGVTAALVLAVSAQAAAPGATAARSEAKRNKAVAVAFTETLHSQHDAAKAFTQYATPNFHHHAQWSGKHGTPEEIVKHDIEAMQNMAKKFPESRREIKQVIAEGNLVMVHSHAVNGGGVGEVYKNPKKDNIALPKTGEQVIDIYRFENGKIAEHWEVSQPTTDLDDVY
jgi:predicted SnoaL-like aldol condensation-catalyzing enzyme